MNLINAFHWLHSLLLVTFALVCTWSWIRGGFWVPRYVHAIALVALVAGVIVTAALPPPTNPNPVVQFVFPLLFPVLFVVCTYGVGVFFVYGHLAAARRNGIPMTVRIIDVPPGEAPEEVRREWVGLILPLAAGETGPKTVTFIGGVLTEPRSFFGQIFRLLTGRFSRGMQYLVPIDSAINILEQKSPEAAKWWRDNTPHLLGVGRKFGFAEEVCEQIGEQDQDG